MTDGSGVVSEKGWKRVFLFLAFFCAGGLALTSVSSELVFSCVGAVDVPSGPARHTLFQDALKLMRLVHPTKFHFWCILVAHSFQPDTW